MDNSAAKEVLSHTPKDQGAAKERGDIRPSKDQLYLAGRINDLRPKGGLGIPAIQKLNVRYGVGPVTAALRLLHGFPPTHLHSVYAYLCAICEDES